MYLHVTAILTENTTNREKNTERDNTEYRDTSRIPALVGSANDCRALRTWEKGKSVNTHNLKL